MLLHEAQSSYVKTASVNHSSLVLGIFTAGWPVCYYPCNSQFVPSVSAPVPTIKSHLGEIKQIKSGKTCAILARCVAVLYCQPGSEFPLQHFKAVSMHTISLMAHSLPQCLICYLNFYCVLSCLAESKKKNSDPI